MSGSTALAGLRVVDLSSGIAGAYATRLLADAGAEVLLVEPAAGAPLRRWSATGADLDGGDGALFRFLAAGKRSLVAEPGDAALARLLAEADLAVEDFPPALLRSEDWLQRHPGLVLLSITPFGRSGPWKHRPATEFTLQAESGSIGTRGLPGGEPFQAGGRIGDWLGGTYAAVAALAAVLRARAGGGGEHVDFSLYEALTVAGTNYSDLTARVLGVTRFEQLPQSVETPSIEPTRDGWVGFCTNSRQQIADFLLLIGHPELRDDEQLAQIHGRLARFDEWNALVHAFTRAHTTAEVIARAAELRIPVAPVLNGQSVCAHEQVVARGMLRREAGGPALHPQPPYRLARGAAGPDAPAPRGRAPRLGEHAARAWAGGREAPAAASDAPAAALPLAGIRILDLTAWWAGPSATHMLAALGADVIHVESPARPDGMRMTGGMARHRYEKWWEASAFFAAANANKRGLALDLARPRGLALLHRLVPRCDALVENFTPRVLDAFGLDAERYRALHPQGILVRMPAFGLDGPWRERPGFAQTMEQLTGLAWLTGHAADQPRIQRGPCDPLSGMHAAFAFLVALEARRRSGAGVVVECTMVEAALAAGAEAIVEFTSHGRLLSRMGNRSPSAAPQGLYRCAGSAPGRERWLALSVATDVQWAALVAWLGRPAWARRAGLATLAGRHAAHDALDAALAPIFAARERDELVGELLAAGVPAAPVADPRLASRSPQHRARGFFEDVSHPVLGEHPVPGVPFRYASRERRWLRAPAPTLGQHDDELLRELLGLGDEELSSLREEGVIA